MENHSRSNCLITRKAAPLHRLYFYIRTHTPALHRRIKPVALHYTTGPRHQKPLFANTDLNVCLIQNQGQDKV